VVYILKLLRSGLLDESKKISIVSDVMFRALFQRDEYIKFPCKLLSYIIDVDYEVLLKNLHFDTTEKGMEIAKNLLNLKIPVKDIMKATRLSTKEIENLE